MQSATLFRAARPAVNANQHFTGKKTPITPLTVHSEVQSHEYSPTEDEFCRAKPIEVPTFTTSQPIEGLERVKLNSQRQKLYWLALTGKPAQVQVLLSELPELSNPQIARIVDTANRQAFNRQIIQSYSPTNRAHMLWHASSKGELYKVTAAYAAGGDVNIANSIGTTALMKASANGHRAIVRALLLAGANVNHTDKDGETALMLAAINGNSGIVKDLLTAKADINQADTHLGETALHKAVLLGHLETAGVLLDQGARVNQRNMFGTTPLMVAAGFGRTALVNLLLDAGADPSLVNADGDTTALKALQKGHMQLACTLNELTRQKKRPKFAVNQAPSHQ